MPEQLYDHLIREGYSLRVESGKLIVSPGKNLSPALIEEIREWKPGLIAIVEHGVGWWDRMIERGGKTSWDPNQAARAFSETKD